MDGDLQGKIKERNRKLLRALYVSLVLLILLYAMLERFNLIPTSVISTDILTFIFGVIVVETFGGIVYYYMINDVHKAEAKTLRDITRIIGYSILVLVILAMILGYQYLNGILVSAGFLGVVIGLAAQSTLSNFIAGIYLLASNTIEPNDHVVLHTWQYTMQPQSYPHDKFVPGFAGTIEAIGVLYTKMINEEGVPVYVPNNIVAQALIINYHRAKEHMRRIQFDISLNVPFDTVEKQTKAIMDKYKVELYTIKVEYLHLSLYVVTIHLKAQEREVREIKSELFRTLASNISNLPK